MYTYIKKSKIILNDSKSIYTGIKYYDKLGKDILKIKNTKLVLPGKNRIVIGDIKIKKLKKFNKSKVVFELEIKTSFEIDFSNKKICLQFFTKPDLKKDEIKIKDLLIVDFYLLDNNLEKLLIDAEKLNMSIIDKEDNKINNSHLSIQEIIK